MSILIYGMKKGKFCHQFSNFTIPPSMKIHKNEVKFKNWICQNFFPENKMDMNLQYKSIGGKFLTLKTQPQQMFRIVTFHVDHTVYTYFTASRGGFECFFMIAQMACDWSLYYVPLEPSNNYYASNKSFFFEFIFCDSSKFLKYADIIFLGPANSSHTF